MADISKINVNDTDYDIKDAVARTNISNLTDIERSASGTIVSFNDGGDNIPVKSLVADITAVQSGSGTPSPSNQRAITGWSQAQITKTGKNLCPYLEQGQLSTTTGEEVASNTVRRSGFIRVEAGQTYAFSNLSTSSTQTNKRLRVFYYDRWKTYINNETTELYDTSVNVTIPSGVGYIRFQASGTVLTETNAQVEKGSTPTTYEAYKDTTYTIALGQTVYGGTLDVTKGILKVTHGIYQFSTCNSVGVVGNSYYAYDTRVEYNPSDIVAVDWSAIVCDRYKTAYSASERTNGTCYSTNARRVVFVDDRFTSLANAEAVLSSEKPIVVYPLATPVVINLTKTQVTTLLNENIIYANSGDISVGYFTQSAKNVSDVANSSNKMDFSNPTGTGALSLNRASGSTLGTNAVSVGHGNTASGNYSYAEGQLTISSGQASHSEGRETEATANYAHVEGYKCIASGQRSHAEGTDTTASGSYSHTEGNATTATNNQAHAEGYQTEASGIASHAENYGAKASGAYSHAQGLFTEANHRSQHVFGEYNVADPSTAASTNKGTYVEIVGNGTNNNHSNARTLDWSGNETLAGGLKLHGNQDAATLNLTGSIAAGATYNFASYSDGAVIFVYRPADASIGDFTGIYIRSTTWVRLIPIKAAPNVTISGYVLTNGTSQSLRCAVIST